MAFGVFRACQAQDFGTRSYFDFDVSTVLFGKTKKKVAGRIVTETFICPLRVVLDNEDWYWDVIKDTLDPLPGGFAF